MNATLFFLRRSLCIVLVLAAKISPLAAAPLHVDVKAVSAILVNADSGAVLFEKNADTLQYPASTTKVATALYMLENKKDALDMIVMADSDSLAFLQVGMANKQIEGRYPAHWLVADGSMVGIKPGERLSLKNLLYGMMLASGNDAANVIAQAVAGSVPLFMKGLNRFLQDAGCRHTFFVNPHGYFHPKHMTTARDMARIATRAMRHAAFREVVKSAKYAQPSTNMQAAKTIPQKNKLLRAGEKYYYPKAIGIKTGYTSKAGYNLVAAAKQGERTLIAVLLHCAVKDEPYQDAIALFNAAFQEPLKTYRIMKKGVLPMQASVAKGRKPVIAELPDDLTHSFYPSEGSKMKAEAVWDSSLSAPISAKQRVGWVRLLNEKGELLRQVPMVASEEVPTTLYYFLHSKIAPYLQAGRKHYFLVSAVASFFAMGLFFLRRR